MDNSSRSKYFIKLGGTVNTGFIIFHLIKDWPYIGLPHFIILSILTFFSYASFFLTEALLTKLYGRIIFGLFCLLYTLRAFRSIQSYIQLKETINVESVLIFIGCILCVVFYITAMVTFKKMPRANR